MDNSHRCLNDLVGLFHDTFRFPNDFCNFIAVFVTFSINSV